MSHKNAPLHSTLSDGQPLQQVQLQLATIMVLSQLFRTYIRNVFLARDANIYISRLCYDVSVRLSVCDGSA